MIPEHELIALWPATQDMIGLRPLLVRDAFRTSNRDLGRRGATGQP